MPSKGSRCGFTIVELTLGLLVIMTVALFALPNVSRMQHIYRLAAASNDVQAHLHYARIQAISKNTDHRMRVTGPTTYVLEHREGGSWVMDRNYSLARGLSISATGSTEFHPRGNANPVATFTVTNPKTEVRQVLVDPSGYIHAQ